MQHFELKIKISYDMNGETPATVMALLYQAAQHLADEGMLSGHTQAEVENWRPEVKMVGDAEVRPARFKCTGVMAPSNVAYIHKAGGSYVCTLANGIPASFFYAVGNCDETSLKFKLEDAENDSERLQILSRIAGPHRKVEMV